MSQRYTPSPDPSAESKLTYLHEEAAKHLVDDLSLSSDDARAVIKSLIAAGYMGDSVEDVLKRWDGKNDVTDAHSASALAKHGHGTHLKRISAGKGFEPRED